MNSFQLPQLRIQRMPNLYIPSLIMQSFDDMQKRAMVNQAEKMRELATPRSFLDPVLNKMARERYAEMYDRTAVTEIAGRILGGAEGAILGAGIGGVLGAIVGSIVPGAGTAAGAALGAKLGMGAATATGVLINAGIGTVGGVALADYTTYHATMEVVNNTIIEFVRNPGRGLLNSLMTLGTTMDQATGATFIKASLASAISGEDWWTKVTNSYGFGDQGRAEMDFSEIREGLGINAGGVGNFAIDMAGEFLTDPGAIGAIGAKIFKKGATKATTEVVENMSKAVSDSVYKRTTKNLNKLITDKETSLLGKKFAGYRLNKFKERIATSILDGNTSDLIKVLNQQGNTFVNNKELELVINRIRKEAS